MGLSGDRALRRWGGKDVIDQPYCSHHAHDGGHIADRAYSLALPAAVEDQFVRSVVLRFEGDGIFGGIDAGKTGGDATAAEELAHPLCQGAIVGFGYVADVDLRGIQPVARTHHGDDGDAGRDGIFDEPHLGPQAVDGIDDKVHSGDDLGTVFQGAEDCVKLDPGMGIDSHDAALHFFGHVLPDAVMRGQ